MSFDRFRKAGWLRTPFGNCSYIYIYKFQGWIIPLKAIKNELINLVEYAGRVV